MPEHDPHDDIESRLTGLPIREPSQMLDARIDETLRRSASASRRTKPRLKRPVLWRYAALAAALFIGAGVMTTQLIAPTPPSATNTPSNPETTDATPTPPRPPQETLHADLPPDLPPAVDPALVTWTRDLGEQLRYAPSGQPYRAVLREVVDRHTWVDPDTGATQEINIPREELILCKQSLF